MSPFKKKGKKVGINNIQSLIPKNLNLNKLKVNPVNAIDGAKNKISNFYNNFKKQREKEKIKIEKKRKLDEKKELQKQKKEVQKEKLDKIRQEKKRNISSKKINS